MKIIGVELRLRSGYPNSQGELKLIPLELDIPDQLFSHGRSFYMNATVHTEHGDVTMEVQLPPGIVDHNISSSTRDITSETFKFMRKA